MLDTYAFHPAFERDVVWHLCNDKKFYFLFHKYLATEKLESPLLQKATALAKGLGKDLGDAPGSSTLVLQRALTQVNGGLLELADYINICDALEAEPSTPDSMAVARLLTPTLRKHAGHERTLNLIKNGSNLGEGKYTEFAELFAEIDRIGQYVETKAPLGFDLDGVSRDVWDAIEGVQNLRRMPCGMDEVDMCFGGGFARPSLTVVAGRPAAGKSLFLSQAAAYLFAAMGKTVALVVISEVPDTMAAARTMAPILGLRIDDIAANTAAENRRLWQAYAEANANQIGGLHIFQFSARTHVREIRKAVNAFYAEKRKRNPEVKLDAVAFDYLGLAGTHQVPANNTNGYVEAKYITQELIEWGQQDDVNILTAVQAVRMKSNGRVIVGMDDIADSQHVVRIADNVLSINVTADENGNNPQNQFLVIKHRLGSSGQLTLPAPVEYGRGLIGQSQFFSQKTNRFWGTTAPAYAN